MTPFSTASSVLMNAVERLCDRDLGEAERDRATDQLHEAAADVRLALDELIELAGATDRAIDGVVVQVPQSRFRRHRWSHHLWR